MALQIGANLISSYELEWKFPHCVMTARQHGEFVLPILDARTLNHLLREVNRKGRVVAGIDEF
jgi:hypothetical protein